MAEELEPNLEVQFDEMSRMNLSDLTAALLSTAKISGQNIKKYAIERLGITAPAGNKSLITTWVDAILTKAAAAEHRLPAWAITQVPHITTGLLSKP